MYSGLKEIEYEALSEMLQGYLDKGETQRALEYCEAVAQAGNPYGYMFMGFIYEEGHGVIERDYKKALDCYEKANARGCDMQEDVVRVKEQLNRIRRSIFMYCDDS